MNHFAIFFLSLLSFFSTACRAEKEHSLLTSVQDAACQSLPLEKAAQANIAKGVEFVSKCQGAKGYHIYLVDDGARSWYVLQHEKGLRSFEEEIVYQQHTKGNFPNVGASGTVEWLIKTNGEPLGLIFSVSSQLVDEKTARFKHLIQYFSIRLDRSSPSLIGVEQDSQQAKKLFKKE